MRATSAPEHFGAAPVSGISRSRAVIRAVWPDREHAVVEVVGRLSDPRGLAELRERTEALLAGGVRYLLVDLSEARSGGRRLRAVLGDAADRLQARDGWLRVHRDRGGLPRAHRDLPEATLADLFAMYRAVAPPPRP